MQKELHLIMQEKGGCGKSFTAWMLAQYYFEKLGLGPELYEYECVDYAKDGRKLFCYDIDPANQTFSTYKTLGVHFFNALHDKNPNRIDITAFDELLQMIATAEAGVHIVDGGASVFMPFLEYLHATHGIVELLNEYGFDVYVHTIISGGQAEKETYNNAKGLITKVSMFENAYKVIWKNPVFGDFTCRYDAFTCPVITLPDCQSNPLERAGVETMQKEGHIVQDLAAPRSNAVYGFLGPTRMQFLMRDMFERIAPALKRESETKK